MNITRRDPAPEEQDEDHPWPGPTGTRVVEYARAVMVHPAIFR